MQSVAQHAHTNHIRPVSHFINGAYVSNINPVQGVLCDVFDPSVGEVIAQGYYASDKEIDLAVSAAEKAFPEWSDTPPAARSKILRQWRQLIEENQEQITTFICQEHGKSKTEAMGSLIRGLDVLDFACGIPTHLKGEYSANVGRTVDCYSIRQPLGVVATITPFNFPVMIALWSASVAIACGNTVVLKPSERNPSAAFFIAELAIKAGLPKGVLNVVFGAVDAVNALITHPKVAAISFVGRTSTARYIQETGIAHGKRVQAFGSAKNHALVMPDTDLTQTVDALVGAAYGSAGERCMAISVVVAVGDELANKLVSHMIPKVKALKIGAYVDPKAEMGPLITQEHRERVTGYIAKGIEEGAKLVVDGRQLEVPEKGYYLAGCLFDHVKPSMTIYQDEIFGPVLCIVRVKDYEEGLQLINSNSFANGVAIFTRDGDCARDFCHRVQVGMVGVNVPIPVPVGYHSFGGWKNSNFGDHGMHGEEGVRFFTKLKTVTSRWPSGIRQGIDFSLPTGD